MFAIWEKKYRLGENPVGARPAAPECRPQQTEVSEGSSCLVLMPN